MTVDLNQLRSERRELFDRCVKASSFNELLEIEVAIANSIRHAQATPRFTQSESNNRSFCYLIALSSVLLLSLTP
ncbi:hypothetical protein ES706_02034 [subsurface metagenome]